MSLRAKLAAATAGAGVLSALSSPALAKAVELKASVAQWVLPAGLTTAAIATASAVAIAALPGVRRMVVPAPSESRLSDILQFLSMHPDGATIRTKDGRLHQTVHLHGLDYGGRSEKEIEAHINRRLGWLLDLCDQESTLKILSIRDQVSFGVSGTFESPFLQRVHDEWMASFETVYQNRHYVVVSTKDDKSGYKRLVEIVKRLTDTLHEYHPNVLTLGEGAYSPLLSFWSHMVNGWPIPIRPADNHLSERLSLGNPVFNRERGLFEYRDGERYQVGLALCVVQWGESDGGELMAGLMSLPGRVQVLHLLQTKAKQRAKGLITLRRQQALAILPNSIRGAEYAAAETLVQGDAEGLVEHQMTVFLSADSLDELAELESAAVRVMRDFGITPTNGQEAVEWLWRCRLPGFDQPVRPRWLLTRNLAGMLEFGEEPTGLARSDWGDGPLRMFRTATGGGYSLQLHVSAEDEALAHSVSFAPSSSGKTTFWEHLMGGALRHPNLACYAFDRMQGMRIFTEAAGGEYINPVDSERISLNPLQCEETPENRDFLTLWLRQLAGQDDDEAQAAISRALTAIFGVKDRRRRVLRDVYESAFDYGSPVKKSLARWVSDHDVGRWFNGATDSLNLEKSRLITFEMTDALKDPTAAAAIVNYIMHRIRSICRASARPHLVFVDETAPMLEDEVFAKNLQVLLREHRKLRGSINMVFQDVGALIRTPIAETVLNQCPTRFIWRNPEARREDYEVLGLTESQWAFVRGQSRLARGLPYAVLVKRGTESVILDISLGALGPYLKAYRSGAEPVALMQSLKQQYGADRWLGEYLDFA